MFLELSHFPTLLGLQLQCAQVAGHRSTPISDIPYNSLVQKKASSAQLTEVQTTAPVITNRKTLLQVQQHRHCTLITHKGLPSRDGLMAIWTGRGNTGVHQVGRVAWDTSR